jgi:hypothetical protein
MWNTSLSLLKAAFPGKVNIIVVRFRILGFRVLDFVSG